MKLLHNNFLNFIPFRMSQLPAFKVLKNELCKNHTLKTIDHTLQRSPWALQSKNRSSLNYKETFRIIELYKLSLMTFVSIHSRDK
jgi:hypothetical protein